MTKGIIRKWIFKYEIYTIAAVAVLIVIALFALRTYYYDEVRHRLSSYADAAVVSYRERSDGVDSSTWVTLYLNKIDKTESIDVAATDSLGRVVRMVTDSSDIIIGEELTVNDRETPDEGVFRIENLPSGERVMTRTAVIRDENGDFVTALTFYEPLQKTERKLSVSILFLILITIVLLIAIFLPTLLFLKSIVKPVRELRATAYMIARGDYEASIETTGDDEIGELADAINHMALEIKASDETRNDFISSVSHELRTPLTAIKGWAETMSDGECDAQMLSKGFGIIINESERLTGMVEELLDFSRLQNGKMILTMDKIDLLAELEEAVFILKERASKDEKHLVFDAPETLPPVFADKNRLRQVFINILDNALKYSPKGGVVGIDALCEGDTIKVIITDSGCGINEKDLPRIKEKFYKANKTVRGSGIGLAVADEIVTLHKGILEIESEEDKGTKVTISIPILDIDDGNILS